MYPPQGGQSQPQDPWSQQTVQTPRPSQPGGDQPYNGQPYSNQPYGNQAYGNSLYGNTAAPAWSASVNNPYSALAPSTAPRPFYKRRLIQIAGGVVVVVAAGAALLVWGPKGIDPKDAAVGDCIAGDPNVSRTVKTVACTDTTAEYKVLGKKHFESELAFNASKDPCSSYPEATEAFWEGRAGHTGTVLCLQDVHNT